MLWNHYTIIVFINDKMKKWIKNDEKEILYIYLFLLFILYASTDSFLCYTKVTSWIWDLTLSLIMTSLTNLIIICILCVTCRRLDS